MAISLESISRSSGIKAPRIVVHGPAGVGKTTFGCGAPNPIFIQTEDGLGKLEVDAFPMMKSFQDVLDALTVLYTSDHNYQTAVIDSVDHLEPLIWQHLCETYIGPKGERFQAIDDFGYGKGFLLALDLWRQLLEGLDALRNEKGMAFILIAHSEIKRFESPTTDSYDRYQIKLHKRASDLVQESVDCVMFADYKTVIEKEEGGFNKVKTRGISTGQRYLYTEARPSFVAKNRYGLPPELPLNWQAFSDALTHNSSQ
ncbi:ATP-binding protein [Endozoicomonas ascidiicola]|uniref:ATP-binding protein n=1 Tax=Endozoicomonas ascidiicola TaxID=1698521 RepID=UPI00082B548A|nr:ATP-binding protein [Endozoicomonas ascidiicola]